MGDLARLDTPANRAGMKCTRQKRSTLIHHIPSINVDRSGRSATLSCALQSAIIAIFMCRPVLHHLSVAQESYQPRASLTAHP